MGQINSTRNNSLPVLHSSAAAGLPSVDVATSERRASSTDAEVSAGARIRRKSFRNSIVGLVRPRDVDAGMPRDRMESRKWWRRFHRQSKALPVDESDSHAILNIESEVHHDASQTQGSRTSIALEIGDADDTALRRPSTHGIHDGQEVPNELVNSESVQTHGPTPVTSSKGKERSVDTSNSNTDNSEDAPSSAGSGNGPHNVLSASVPSDSSSVSSVPDTSAQPSFEPLEASSPSRGRTIHQPASNDNILRRFPPAGTLVVVQGIVQTDGTPRSVLGNPASSQRAAQLPSRSTTQHQSLPPEVEPNSSRVSLEPSVTEASGSCTPAGVVEDPATNTARGESSESPEEVPGSASSTGLRSNLRRQTSSNLNGVDVLGALLSIVSVATAATAASLLSIPSGSPRPSWPSADQPNVPTRTPPANPLEGSAMPVVARALASANPIAAAVLAQQEREREERERIRVRSIWEGLRERVTNGRGRRGPLGFGSRPHSSTIAPGRDRAGDSPVIPDALFADLARAFNLGSASDERPAEAQDASTVHPNPEEGQGSSFERRNSLDRDTDDTADSFERFLVDLQSDLRTALTRSDSAQNDTSTTESGENIDSEGSGNPSGIRDANTSEGINIPPNTDIAESSMAEIIHRSDCNERGHVSGLPSVDNSVAGPACPASGAVILERGSSASATERETILAEHNPSTASILPSSTGNGGSNGNGINWWRMYRFPPMRPVHQRQNNTDHDSQDSSIVHTPATSTGPSNNASTTETLLTSEPASQEGAGTVIPVIVVGLQSISSGTRRSPPSSDSTAEVDDTASESTRETMSSDNGSARSSPGPRRGRGSWPSRAARAFSRMGRRGDLAADQGYDAQNPIGGARTFFIYVFGGHYPPNHHILSGSDAIDSFEALWELADLLGQAKSPVVTDEDIERSGLELFKARALGEFGSGGRVASNCVDRCLICLDDYDPDDDLRLLSCKHTFHRVCVDRWLKTGRNNCPACRSEGVRTGGGTSVPSF